MHHKDKLTKENAFVSIIIPTLNSEATLQSCLESVLAQDYPAYEVLIVDGCSTDRTVEIVKKFPVKLLTEKKRTFIGDTRIGKSSNKKELVESTNGCNSAYRKDAIFEVGGFDSNNPAAEEIELEWRLAIAGYKILFTPEAHIMHNRKFTFKNTLRWLYRHGYFKSICHKS